MKETVFVTLLLASLTTCTTKQQEGSAEDTEKTVSQSQVNVEDLPADSGKDENLLKIETKLKEESNLPVVAGIYNGGFLLLAYDGNLVTGFYANGRYQGNPNFGCSFYFYGSSSEQIGDRKINIMVLNPFNLAEEPRQGTFKLHDEEDKIFSLVANLNADDCWDRELGFVDISKDPGIGFELSERKPWLEIRIAAAERVYFHNTTDEGTKRETYVIKGDPLIISKIEGEWLKATFMGEKSAVTGWVKKKDTKSFPELVEKESKL
jgi:hypothetical protein